jgi:hypothetical protein
LVNLPVLGICGMPIFAFSKAMFYNKLASITPSLVPIFLPIVSLSITACFLRRFDVKSEVVPADPV